MTGHKLIKDHSDIREGDLVRLSYQGSEFEGKAVELPHGNGLYVGPMPIQAYRYGVDGCEIVSVLRPVAKASIEHLDRVLLVNKETGQELPEATFVMPSFDGDYIVQFDGTPGGKPYYCFNKDDWEIQKVFPEPPTTPGTVIVNATIWGNPGITARLDYDGYWSTTDYVEGVKMFLPSDITEWALGKPSDFKSDIWPDPS